MLWQFTIAWTETSDVKMTFLEIFLSFKALGNLIYCSCAAGTKIYVVTKIGRYFLNLIDKHFHQDHKFYKIFNKNCKKVSYSCMLNTKSAIISCNR